VPLLVGLMIQLETVSGPTRLKSAAQTFVGTLFGPQEMYVRSVVSRNSGPNRRAHCMTACMEYSHSHTLR
jgi:hypothetical protein